MAPSARPPVGESAVLWASALAALASKKPDEAAKLAAAALGAAKADGLKYGEAGASLVSALADAAKAVPKTADLLTILTNIGATWGEAAELFALAAERVAAAGPAEAVKAATAAAGTGDDWSKAGELSVVVFGTLKKDGPAGPRDTMVAALALCAEVGLAWGDTGVVGSAASLHSCPVRSEKELVAAIDLPAKAKAGKEKGLAILAAAGAWLEKGEAGEALQSARDALAVLRELDAKDLEATALHMSAKAYLADGAVMEALGAANKAVMLFKELGHKKGEAMSMLTVAAIYQAKPSPEEAANKAKAARKSLQVLGCRVEEGKANLMVAKASAAYGDNRRVLQAAKDAVAIAQELGDSVQEGAALSAQSQMSLVLGEQQAAMEAATAALSKVKNLGDQAAVLCALDAVVAVNMAMDKPAEAMAALSQAQADFKSSGSIKGEAAVLCKMGEAQLQNNEPDQGIASVREAVALYGQAGDAAGRVKALVLQAELCAAQHDYHEASTLAEAAVMASKELGRKGLADYMAAVSIGVKAKSARGNFDQAESEAVAALRYFNTRREKKFEAYCILEVAAVREQVGNTQKSLDTLMHAPALFLASGDLKGLASAWLKMAQLHANKGEADLALSAAKEAKDAYNKVGDKAGKAGSNQLIAEANFVLVPGGAGNAKDALSAAQEVVNIYKATGDKLAEGEALNSLANAQLMNKSPSEALRTARQAEECFTELRNVSGQASALLLASGAQVGEGRFGEAKETAREACDLFKEAGDSIGEDTAEDFQDTIDQYQSGKLDIEDFMGFSITMVDKSQRKKQRKKGAKAEASTLVDYELFSLTAKGQRDFMARFMSFESRAARAPVARGRQASGPEGGAGPGASKKQVLYGVRWVGKPAPPEAKFDPPENLQRDVPGAADKRLAYSMELSEPHQGFGGRFAPSQRMFHAMGGQQGI